MQFARSTTLVIDLSSDDEVKQLARTLKLLTIWGLILKAPIPDVPQAETQTHGVPQAQTTRCDTFAPFTVKDLVDSISAKLMPMIIDAINQKQDRQLALIASIHDDIKKIASDVNIIKLDNLASLDAQADSFKELMEKVQDLKAMADNDDQVTIIM